VGEGELARLVTTLMPTPWVVTLHAHTLDEVFLDIRKVGEALELRDEAEELDAGLRYRLRRVGARATKPMPERPRVLVLEWVDPPYVAGHWTPQMIELAGGEDVLGRLGEPYISTRAGAADHMGLGIFIAQSLLERSGARLVFDNLPDGGAHVAISWNRANLEMVEKIRPPAAPANVYP